MKNFELKADGLGPWVQQYARVSRNFVIHLTYEVFDENYVYYKGFNTGSHEISLVPKSIIDFIDIMDSELWLEVRNLHDIIKFKKNPENFAKDFMKPTDKIYEVKL